MLAAPVQNSFENISAARPSLLEMVEGELLDKNC